MLSFIEFKVVFFYLVDDFISRFFFKILQFRSVNLLYIKMLMSSTMLIKLKSNLTSSHAFNKSAL